MNIYGIQIDEWMEDEEECPEEKSPDSSNQPRLAESSTSADPHLSSGNRREDLKLTELEVPPLDIVELIYLPILQQLQIQSPKDSQLQLKLSQILQLQNLQEKACAIVEFLRLNREMILEDKWNIFSPFIPRTLLSKIAEVDLTINVEAYRDLFRESLREKSKKLLLPIKTAYAVLDMSFYSGSSNSFPRRLPFSIKKYIPQIPNLQTISLTSYTFFPVEETVREDIRNKKNKAKQKRKTKIVIKENSPKMCPFLIAIQRKVNNEKAYKPCGARLIEEETSCPEHQNQASPDGIIWPYLCKFIISQSQGVDRTRSRKGLPCLNVCDKNQDYCSSHRKSVNKVKENAEDKLEVKTVIRACKFRVNPTKKQKEIYKRMAGCCRKTKNWILEKEGENSTKTFVELRKLYVNEEVLVRDKEFLKSCPKASRDIAMKSYETERDNLKKFNEKLVENNKKKQERYDEAMRRYYQDKAKGKRVQKPKALKFGKPGSLKFAKKKGAQVLPIDKKAVKITPTGFDILRSSEYFGKHSLIRVHRRVRGHDKLFKKFQTTDIQHDISLCKTPSGKYYMHVPYDVEINSKPALDERKGVAIDPGVRKIMTTYDTDGIYTEYGKGFASRITELRHKAKSIIEAKRKIRGVKGGSPQLRRRYEEKIKNKVDDLHYHCIKALTEEYTDILIPRMNVREMVQGEDLDPEVKRLMLDIRFGQLRTRLINKVEVLGNGRNVLTCNEARTSKTCSRCFNMRQNLGRAEVYKCNRCPNRMDRDWNGCTNIFLKYFKLC